MYSQHPDIAKRWEAVTPKDAKLPEHVPGRLQKAIKKATSK